MIVLMRHARTSGAEGRCIGRTDVSLSPKGEEQAVRLAEVLSGVEFARFLSSPAGRARDTIAPLARHLGVDVACMPGLNEIDMGEWDGLDFSDIRERFPTAYAERGKSIGQFRTPGGESFAQVADRGMAALQALARLPQPVLAVSHAGVIRSLLCRVSGYPLDDLFHFRPDHLSCAVFAPDGGETSLVARDVKPEDLHAILRG